MSASRPQWWRVGLLVLVIAAIWLIGWATGAHEYLTTDQIQHSIGSAGGWGFALFVALFCLGQVAQVSGHPFIAASVFAWGWWEGALVSIAAATLGAVVSFALARKIGGDVRGTKKPLIQKVVSSLEDAPLRTITVARAILMTAPPLAPVFALSGVRHRDHAIATFLGLVPSVLISAYAWGVGLSWLGLSG